MLHDEGVSRYYFLLQERVDRADAFVAVTGDDRANLLAAMYASQLGAKLTVAGVSRGEFAPLAEALGVDVTVLPRILAAGAILQFVRRGEIAAVTLLKSGAQMIELGVPKGCPAAGQPLSRVRFPKGAIVGAVSRGEEVIVPTGQDVLAGGLHPPRGGRERPGLRAAGVRVPRLRGRPFLPYPGLRRLRLRPGRLPDRRPGVGGGGGGRLAAVLSLRAHGTGGCLFRVHGRVHDHRRIDGSSTGGGRALHAAVAQPDPVGRGVGILVLFVAVAPLVGLGATQLFSAEVANPISERITPRIRETAKVLSYVYGGLMLGGVLALLLAGMGPFDAVNHALTTVSTGGFSTRSDSIAAFDSWAIELVLVAGMVLSGTNFALYFYLSQGRPGRALGNREFLAYLSIIAGGTALVTATLYAFDYQDSLVLAFREALFQTVSLVTGTAYNTAAWGS